MARIYIFLALIIQSSLIHANNIEDNKNETESVEVPKHKHEVDDTVVKDFHGVKRDWIDMFLLPGGQLFPTSSAAMMTQVTNCDKSPEEQLEDIKEVAAKITQAIQNEMANLLSYAITCEKDKEGEDSNKLRKRRSIETPMDSTQLVMRLLKHIKSNNEYQNIAIEKMMSAQEIADKYGIEFNPDTEILSDLAVAANEQAKELTSILQDACEYTNSTKQEVEFMPLEQQSPVTKSTENDSYFVYSVYPQEHHHHNAFPPHEYQPEHIHASRPPPKHQHHPYHNYPETQIMAPPHSPPVTPKPSFYDSVMAFTPADYYPYCMEPITTTTTIVLPIEELVPEPEPELVGEEYEEVVSSKVIVNQDEEPGSATVNHVMTYTLSEKAHFKTPQIEKLPEQMQYTFFLM